MAKRPSNTLFYVFLSLVIIFGLYIAGGLILDARQNESLDTSQGLGQFPVRGNDDR